MVTTYGPSTYALTLHTGVEGPAARTGHDLTLRFARWQATVSGEPDRVEALQVDVDVTSLEVVEGHGGLTPLDPVSKQVVRRNALKLLRAQDHPRAAYASTGVTPVERGWTVVGTLTVAGVSHPLALAVTTAQTLQTSVLQTEHGIRPYSAAFGALRVRDEVAVRVLPLS